MNHLLSVRMAYDPQYNVLHDLVACKNCSCPNFDMITLLEKEHLTCPRCQTDPTITPQLMKYLIDKKKIIEEVLPVLRRNGKAAMGDVNTTWREPFAADVEAELLGRDHLESMYCALSQTSPEMASCIDIKKVRLEAEEQLIGMTRNMPVIMPPAPMHVNDLQAWDLATLQNAEEVRKLQWCGMEEEKKASFLGQRKRHNNK